MKTKIGFEVNKQAGKSESRLTLKERSLHMGKTMCLFVMILAAVLLSACAGKGEHEQSYCPIDMHKYVSIDVTDADPRTVFDQLDGQADCSITVSPFVRKHVTLHAVHATVASVFSDVCQQIGCKYILNDNHVTIKPYTIIDKLQAAKWKKFNQVMAERQRILESRLPEGMRFENITLTMALQEISKATGLEFKPWKDEGERKVTIDVSGMIVNDAVKALLLNVAGEGAVLIKPGSERLNSYGQHWPFGYPPVFGK